MPQTSPSISLPRLCVEKGLALFESSGFVEVFIVFLLKNSFFSTFGGEKWGR